MPACPHASRCARAAALGSGEGGAHALRLAGPTCWAACPGCAALRARTCAFASRCLPPTPHPFPTHRAVLPSQDAGGLRLQCLGVLDTRHPPPAAAPVAGATAAKRVAAYAADASAAVPADSHAAALPAAAAAAAAHAAVPAAATATFCAARAGASATADALAGTPTAAQWRGTATGLQAGPCRATAAAAAARLGPLTIHHVKCKPALRHAGRFQCEPSIPLVNITCARLSTPQLSATLYHIRCTKRAH